MVTILGNDDVVPAVTLDKADGWPIGVQTIQHNDQLKKGVILFHVGEKTLDRTLLAVILGGAVLINDGFRSHGYDNLLVGMNNAPSHQLVIVGFTGFALVFNATVIAVQLCWRRAINSQLGTRSIRNSK